MNFKNEIVKNFSIGFLPIAIFLVADWIYGPMIGIAIALLFGSAELLFFYLKDRKFEKFIVFDLVLLFVFGIVSLLLENMKEISEAGAEILVCGSSVFNTENPAHTLKRMKELLHT